VRPYALKCLAAAASLSFIATQVQATDSLPTLEMEQTPAPTLASQRIDRVTALALVAIGDDNLDQARALMRDLVDDYPDYHLGQLLLAELHAAHVSLPSALQNPSYKQPLLELLLEASARQNSRYDLAVPVTSIEHHPTSLIKVGSDVTHLIQVNLEDGLQTVFAVEQRQLEPLWRQYIGYGSGGFGKRVEGDLKTPLGVYRINGYRDDKSLPELYGVGALMLDYPNLADRFAKRTGSGIWLHGVPRHSRSRGPLSSEGCVIMGNDYIETLSHELATHSTLVALSSHADRSQTRMELAPLKAAFLQWRTLQLSEYKLDFSDLTWDNITIAVSSADAIGGEPQQVTMYFADPTAEKKGESHPELKALFWQRSAPGSNTWELIADEIGQRGA